MDIHHEQSYRLVSGLFLRLLGITYLIAFASIATQVEGLAGSQGIEPFADKLARIPADPGVERYLRLPTLFWLDSSDTALGAAPWIGGVAGLLIALGRWQRVSLIVAYALYLSLYHACQPFLNFQWDGLLLEAGLLAIFLTPRSRLVIFLFRWLLFRLRFMSGLSKLTSGDPTWSGLTALNHYFEVQPLPTPLAWYAHQLPDWLLKAGTAGTLFIELVVPFMMFLPRRWRFLAAWLTILLQVLIILTSNHNWFNFLTIFLCLFLFDDRALQRALPAGLRRHLSGELPPPDTGAVRRVATGLLALSVLIVSGLHFRELMTMRPLSGPLGTALDYAEAWRAVNKYHVFGSMKTERLELEIWGSIDGSEWRRYDFRYKPDDLDERPAVVIPFQPRLDWQMWFVTLHPRHMPWFRAFLDRLLENAPQVQRLLADRPFPAGPPRYIRVYLFRYRFTDFATRAETGNWWRREYLGEFPPLPWVRRPDTPEAAWPDRNQPAPSSGMPVPLPGSSPRVK